MYSGTYDSILYDLLLQETGKTERFEKFLGRIRLIDGLALVLGSLCGGLIAGWLEPRATYFLTIPLVLVSIIALWCFKEPTLHKSEISEPIIKHIKTTFGAVFQKGRLLQIVAIMAIMGVLVQFSLEFGQLWLVALLAPVFLYGPANAALMAAYGFGGVAAERIQIFQIKILYPIVALMIASSLTLVFVKQAIVDIIALFVLTFFGLGLGVIFTKLLHDALPSKVRAGASSAVSTTSWLIFLPFALLFGYVSKQHTVFAAGWFIVAVTLVGCGLMIKASRHKDFRVPDEPQIAPEIHNK